MTYLRFSRRLALAALAAAAGLVQAASPTADDFAWRATVHGPAGAPLVRVEVPPGALLQLQSSGLRDLRVFNGAGDAVPFALLPPPAPVAPPQRERTTTHPALPLFSAEGRPARGSGSAQVRIEDGPGRSVWVQLDGRDVPDAARLGSVLFAPTRQVHPIAAIEVQGTIPPNAPVSLSASSSADLAQWTPLPLHGRLYRFEGANAPANMVLEFESAVTLKDRFLRLDWGTQSGVSITGINGLLAADRAAAQPQRVLLPAPRAAGAGALELATGFATPLSGIALDTAQPNTLWPVRILARSEPSQPWRQIAQTVVYRFVNGGAAATNPPVALPGVSARWLRIEPANGADLSQAKLEASAQFQTIQLVFVASGPGPFQLVAGREGTPAAALPLPTIAGTLGSARLEDLPHAAVDTPVLKPRASGFWASLWPGTGVSARVATLWAVLLGGVAVLAAVAWSLLRQLKRPAAGPQ